MLIVSNNNKYTDCRGTGLFLFLLVFCLSCAGTSVGTDTGPDSKNTGWIDDSTFVVTTIGKPVRKYTDIKERRNSARRAAIINAQFRILKRFKKFSAGEGKKTAMSPQIRAGQAAKINSIIKSGKVQSEQFDKMDNCEIFYKVRFKNLKQFISEADLTSIDVIN